jgi:hypothetical protein
MALSEQARRNIEAILRLADLPADGFSLGERVESLGTAIHKHCTPELLATFEEPLSAQTAEMFAVILRSSYEQGRRMPQPAS